MVGFYFMLTSIFFYDITFLVMNTQDTLSAEEIGRHLYEKFGLTSKSFKNEVWPWLLTSINLQPEGSKKMGLQMPLFELIVLQHNKILSTVIPSDPVMGENVELTDKMLLIDYIWSIIMVKFAIEVISNPVPVDSILE
jgi:hypothetical protein